MAEPIANQMQSKPFTKRTLAHTIPKAEIIAPTGFIDLTDWLFHVDEWDYKACTPTSHAHKSAAFTHAPDGRRMSINVEDFGQALVVEHYVEDISEKLHCKVASISDVLIGREYTTVEAVWEITAKPLEGDRHEFINNCGIYTTPEYDAYLVKHGKSYESARDEFQKALEAHCAEETPYFAASIQRRVLSSRSLPQ